MATDDYEMVSGLDDLFYDVTLTDESTGAALTTGTVSMRLCAVNTATALGGLAAATQALTHVAAGRWTGVHDGADVSAAVTTLSVGQRFDRCVIVAGLTGGRRVARCKRVAVVAEEEE